MNVVTITVKVYENGEERATKTIRYFEGQTYAVKIDTPDGVDVEEHFTAGCDPVLGEARCLERSASS